MKCPGRHFASTEIKLVAAMMMTFFDMEVIDPLPAFDQTRNGFGVLPPVGEMRVRLKVREGM